MSAPFDDNENTRIAQPDYPDYSSFEGPWNEDFESTYIFLFVFYTLLGFNKTGFKQNWVLTVYKIYIFHHKCQNSTITAKLFLIRELTVFSKKCQLTDKGEIHTVFSKL